MLYKYKDHNRVYWTLEVTKSTKCEEAGDCGSGMEYDYYWDYTLTDEDKTVKVTSQILGQCGRDVSLQDCLRDIAIMFSGLTVGFSRWGISCNRIAD